MPNIARVRAIWNSAAVVGGGVSTFYFDEAASGFQAAVADFFQAIEASLPVGQQIFVPNSGDLLDVATGALSGVWSEGSGETIVGQDTQGYAAGVGIRVVWPTAGIRNGRRVKGSTFMCPIGKNSFEGSANIATATITLYESAASALLTSQGSDMKIWSRPRNGSGGQAFSVIGREVPDEISWLRSRRT